MSEFGRAYAEAVGPCSHEWVIAAETNGQESVCRKCKKWGGQHSAWRAANYWREQFERLEAKHAALVEAAAWLRDKYIANKGTEDEFIKCIGSANPGTQDYVHEAWRKLDKALAVEAPADDKESEI